MHTRPRHQQGNLIWMFSGTGEGPILARSLLALGWRVRVSVVSSVAALAYQESMGLEVTVGPIGGSGAVAEALAAAEAAGDPPVWLVDATHPFARRISAELALACRLRGQPLLRLQRPLLPEAEAIILADLGALRRHSLVGLPLMLAIGARQLAAAVACSPGALHHARLLPNPASLSLAMAAGLKAERVACLRPTSVGLVERALCRRWGIKAVLCRRSGGETETLWHRLSAELDLRLLLLERPPDVEGVECHGPESLLERLGRPASQPTGWWKHA